MTWKKVKEEKYVKIISIFEMITDVFMMYFFGIIAGFGGYFTIFLLTGNVWLSIVVGFYTSMVTGLLIFVLQNYKITKDMYERYLIK